MNGGVCMPKRIRFVKLLKDYLTILFGSFITAMALNIFLVPYKIAPGGVSGIATVLFYISDGRLSVGLTMLALNIPLFVAGIKLVGGRFGIRTLFSTVALSIIIDSTAGLGQYIQLTFLSTQDILLVSIYGGFFMGLGLGIVFRTDATTGGTDLAARILHRFFPNVTMGKLLLFIDSSVIVFAIIAFNNLQLGLYAILTLYISSHVIDAILEGVNYAKAVFVISDKSDLISGRILKELDRGVTGLEGMGMYTRKQKQVLFCVVTRQQIPVLKTLALEVDPNAFVIMADVREVVGEGFGRTI